MKDNNWYIKLRIHQHIVRNKKSILTPKGCGRCHCQISLHHAKQKQKLANGYEYIRTCYGIGCRCEE